MALSSPRSWDVDAGPRHRRAQRLRGAELRSVIGFFILLPLVMASGGFAAMRTQRPVAHIARNISPIPARRRGSMRLPSFRLPCDFDRIHDPDLDAILASASSRKAFAFPAGGDRARLIALVVIVRPARGRWIPSSRRSGRGGLLRHRLVLVSR